MCICYLLLLLLTVAIILFSYYIAYLPEDGYDMLGGKTVTVLSYEECGAAPYCEDDSACNERGVCDNSTGTCVCDAAEFYGPGAYLDLALSSMTAYRHIFHYRLSLSLSFASLISPIASLISQAANTAAPERPTSQGSPSSTMAHLKAFPISASRVVRG